MKFEINYVEQLAKLLADNDLTEITLEEGDRAIVLKREKEIITAQAVAPTIVSAPSLASTITSQVAPEAKEAKDPATKGTPVSSPMVGTFYRSPSPDSKPFVSVGDVVAKGQVVCIIEAMKLMNEIESEASGKIVEICIQDGEPVEYGQVIMYVE